MNVTSNDVKWEYVNNALVNTLGRLDVDIRIQDMEAQGMFYKDGDFLVIEINANQVGTRKGLTTLAHESVHYLQHLHGGALGLTIPEHIRLYVRKVWIPFYVKQGLSPAQIEHYLTLEGEALLLENLPIRVLNLLREKLGMGATFDGKVVDKDYTHAKKAWEMYSLGQLQ